MGNSYRKGDHILVTIEKIVPRGFGLGYAENLTVLVPLAAVGDAVLVRIKECKKRMAFAEIVEIKRPGPARITAPCSQYGVCGGCDFQHLKYTAQLQAKVGIIRDCLKRIGKIDLEIDIPITGSPEEFEYRSRARWHVDPQKRAFGYKRRDSNEVVDISGCLILTAGMQSALDYLRSSADLAAYGDGQVEIEAVSGEGGRISTQTPDSAADSVVLTVDLGGENYAYSADVFFQANRSLVPKLIEVAIGDCAGAAALDLYCGVGLFSLPLARRFGSVVGVEENKRSAELARKNAVNARLVNLEFLDMSVGRFLRSRHDKKFDLVLLDPPRTGPEDGVIDALTSMGPPQICYVSCEPSILARDLRRLLDAGYAIRSIAALDMFPQTHHVETVLHLNR